MSGISLLPEELRGKEEQLSKPTAEPAGGHEDLSFSMPTQQEEDIEIIEVDEGELDQVLAGEPPLARLAFKVQNLVQNVLARLRGSGEKEPPPKLPPQFFTPPPVKPTAPVAGRTIPGVPAPGAKAPAAGAGAAPAVQAGTQAQKPRPAVAPVIKAKPSAAPAVQQPRRVRIIKRVRKPVNVSFVSNEALFQSRADVPKRKFTFAATFTVFALLFGASYAYLYESKQVTKDSLDALQGQVTDVNRRIVSRQKSWTAFKDLEPHLKALNALLDAHVSPTSLLADIEAVTLPKVSYGTMNLTDDGKVSLSVTVDSFETAAKQVLAYKRADFVKKVDVSSYSASYDEKNKASLVPKAVTFQLTVTLGKSAMLPGVMSSSTTAYVQ